MNFLLDTNIVSEVMKPKPHPSVDQWFGEQTLIILSVISVEEIYAGLYHKDTHRNMDWFDDLLQSRAQTLHITPEIAAHSAKLRGNFRRQGITRSQPDMLIAATALYHGLVLATRNVRDFDDCGISLLNPFID